MKKRWLFILAVLMIAVTMFVACNSEVTDASASAQPGKELVYATFGNSSSKDLSVSYNFIDYTKLYWFYQATKEDSFGTTGEVTGSNWAKVPGDSEGKGLDGTVGPFSQGLWLFALAGYQTKTDSEPSGSYIHYGDYYYSDLVYSGASTGTVSLKYGDSNAIPVTVEPAGTTGKIYLDGITYAWDNNSTATGTVTLQIKITPVSGTQWTDSKEWVYDSGYTLADYVLNNQAGVDIPTGTYNLDFTVCAIVDNDVAYEFAEQSLSLTVFGSQTTTITGSLVEGLLVENAHFVATDVASVIVIPTTTGANFETDKTPAGSGENKKTTVTVPTGTLTTGTQNNMTIELVSIDIAQDVASQKSWSVADNSSAVAALTITLKEVVTTTDPTTGSVTVEEKPITTFAEAVTVTTYIETGLTGVRVFYNGDLDDPTDVTYDAATGCLTFKTTHFSEFYVTSTSEILNVDTGVKYTTLAEAVDKAVAGQTLRLIKDITDPGLVINKSLILDLYGQTWTCSDDGTNPNTRAMTITGSSDFTLIDTSDDVNNNEFGSRKKGKIITSEALYGAVRFDSCGELIVKDVTLENCKDNGLNIKINADANTTDDIPGPYGCTYLIENVTINSTRGGGIEANYSNVEGIVKNCSVSQTDVGDPSWVSTALAVAYGATMTVENGDYSGSTVLYIYSSGGTFVVNDGSFTTESNVIQIGLDKNKYPSSSEKIEVYDGNFEGAFQLNSASSASEIQLYGGVYDHDPSAYVAPGYYAKEDTPTSGLWTVECVFDGKGTKDDPFKITSTDDFLLIQNLSDSMRGGNEYYFKLTNDIDLRESLFSTKYVIKYFAGGIDGRKTETESYKIYAPNDSDVSCLIDCLNDSEFSNIEIVLDDNSVSLIGDIWAGETFVFDNVDFSSLNYSGKVYDIEHNGSLYFSYNFRYGGSGWGGNYTVKNCDVKLNLNGASSSNSAVFVGGYAYNKGNSMITVTDCTYEGTFRGNYVALVLSNGQNSFSNALNITGLKNNGTLIGTGGAYAVGAENHTGHTDPTIPAYYDAVQETTGGTYSVITVTVNASVDENDKVVITDKSADYTYTVSLYADREIYDHNGNQWASNYNYAINFGSSDDVYRYQFVDYDTAIEQGYITASDCSEEWIPTNCEHPGDGVYQLINKGTDKYYILKFTTDDNLYSKFVVDLQTPTVMVCAYDSSNNLVGLKVISD